MHISLFSFIDQWTEFFSVTCPVDNYFPKKKPLLKKFDVLVLSKILGVDLYETLNDSKAR